MADNYVDVPVLICKLYASGTCTTGGILQADDTAGWVDATTDSQACGIIAMEPGAAGYYVSCMIMGTAWMRTNDSVGAGQPVKWISDSVVDCLGDCACKTIGMMIDGTETTAGAASRCGRVFFNGQGHKNKAW